MIQENTLNNGLRIISDNDDNAKTVTISYVVNCGSYNEDSSNLGIAHFTEHMLFKGTINRTSQEISESIEGIGGILNASTSFEETQYYCTVPEQSWKTGIEVLSDMIWNNLIPEKEFQKECQVILEELKMYDDEPSSKIWDLLFQQLHPGYINRRLVGGTLESVNKLTRDQMINFIDKYYVPNNMVVIATGKINHDDLVKFVDNYCSNIEIQSEQIINNNQFIPDKLEQNDFIFEKDVAQSHMCWGIFGPPTNTKDYITSEVIASLLGGNSSSRLYQIIREQKGLAYTVFMDVEGLKDNSILNGYVGLDGNNIKEVKKIVINELERLKTEAINEEELTRTKEYIKGSTTIKLEKTSSRNSFIGGAIITNSDINIENYLIEIDKVTTSDIIKFSNDYFRSDNICFVQIIPK